MQVGQQGISVSLADGDVATKHIWLLADLQSKLSTHPLLVRRGVISRRCDRTNDLKDDHYGIVVSAAMAVQTFQKILDETAYD